MKLSAATILQVALSWRRNRVGVRLLSILRRKRADQTDLPSTETTQMYGWKTLTGIVGMAVSWLAGVFGIGDCTPEQVQQFGEAACQSPEAIVTELADRVAFLGFMLLGIWGRISAARKAKAASPNAAG